MFKKNYKKILAIMLIMFTLLIQLQPIIYAEIRSGRFTGRQWASFIRTQESSGQFGVLIRNLTNIDTGQTRTVFCVEYGVPFYTGLIYDGIYFAPTNPSMLHIARIAYFGWFNRHGDVIVGEWITTSAMYEVRKEYVFTQVMIWEYLGTNTGIFLNATHQAEYNAFRARVNTQIANMTTRPSFNASEIEMEVGETRVLVDTNGVLQYYNSIDVTVDGIRFQHTHGQNALTITVTEATTRENFVLTNAMAYSWNFMRRGSENHNTTLYFQFPEGEQDQIFALHYNDPVLLTLALRINQYGSLELTKTNTNRDLIDGSVFNLTGPNGFNQNVTVTNGRITVDGLRRGTYTLREINAPHGYILNTQNFTVTINPNQTTTQTVVNEEPTGTVDIIKLDSEIRYSTGKCNIRRSSIRIICR